MFRLIRMTGKWYAVELHDLEDDLENINIFVEGGDIIVLTDDIDTFRSEFGIIEEIEMVEA